MNKLTQSSNTLFAVIIVVFVLITFDNASASFPVSYSADVTIPITSPVPTNFTIKNGSNADTVTINSADLVVSVSSGETFTMNSASVDVSVTGSHSGITVTQTCSSGVAQVVINSTSGSGSYILAATSSACIPATPTPTPTPIQSSSGGGAGGVGFPASTMAPLSTTLPSASSMPLPVLTPNPAASTSIPAIAGYYRIGNDVYNPQGIHITFTQAQAADIVQYLVLIPQEGSQQSNRGLSDLQTGQTRGAAINALQRFLNTHGFVLATSGPGSPGNETNILGFLTSTALGKFQKTVNLSVTGTLDKATVNYFKLLGL